jgi:hypothetical protein
MVHTAFESLRKSDNLPLIHITFDALECVIDSKGKDTVYELCELRVQSHHQLEIPLGYCRVDISLADG